MEAAAEASENKALVSCRLLAGGQRLKALSSGRGDREEGGFGAAGCHAPGLQQGSCGELCFLKVLMPLSPAGRGGEGRRGCGVLEAVAWRWWGLICGGCELWFLVAFVVFPSPAGRGGEGDYGRWLLVTGSGALGTDRLARLRSSSTEAMIADVILGQWRPLRAVMCSWHYSFFFLQVRVPCWRIFGFGMAQHTAFGPSGVVPGVIGGGHASKPYLSYGGGEGPDCFFFILFRVLFAYAEDQVVMSVFLQVLFVFGIAK
jgi:hypothetical protein